MKITLRPCKPYPKCANVHCVEWKQAPPFNVSPRGILIHRVKCARSHTWAGKYSHDAVGYWCGNSACGDGVSLTEDPPDSRLLCKRCEEMAVAAGEPTATDLVGRHIHIGTLRAYRECCRDDQN